MFNFWKKSNYTAKKINSLYSQYLYTGLLGSLMRYCHRELEKKLPDGDYKKILEIGAGPEPHVIYIKSISLINISDIIIIETIFSLSNFDSCSIFILICFNLFVCLFYYLL